MYVGARLPLNSFTPPRRLRSLAPLIAAYLTRLRGEVATLSCAVVVHDEGVQRARVPSGLYARSRTMIVPRGLPFVVFPFLLRIISASLSTNCDRDKSFAMQYLRYEFVFFSFLLLCPLSAGRRKAVMGADSSEAVSVRSFDYVSLHSPYNKLVQKGFTRFVLLLPLVLHSSSPCRCARTIHSTVSTRSSCISCDRLL